MQAVQLKSFGTTDQLYIGEYPDPSISDREVLIKVKAFALNRADLLQRQGKYPPPPGESEILGLEVAGEIIAIGEKVTNYHIGDRVFTLVGGGGYAQLVKSQENMLMHIPQQMAYHEAAGIAETFLTAWQTLVWHSRIKKDDKVLIHAGASGVGIAAIQIAKFFGARIAISASAGKHAVCRSYGAEICIDYRKESFEEVIKREWGGVDIVVDFIGEPYFNKNLNVLSVDGKMIILGLMGGIMSEINLIRLLSKSITIIGSTLRSRTEEYKAQLTADFKTNFLPSFTTGKSKVHIDSLLPWSAIKTAHDRMEANLNTGKIIMTID